MSKESSIQYGIELGNGIVLPALNEADAIECHQLAEYVCGHVAVVVPLRGQARPVSA